VRALWLLSVQAKSAVARRSRLSQQNKGIRVHPFVTHISAERFWEANRPLPPGRIASNLNFIGLEKPREDLLEAPFIYTVNYTPAVAQITLKGKAHITGEKEELNKILAEHKEKKPLPPLIMQTVSNVAILESLLISRTLSVPPPIPLPAVSPPASGEKKTEPSYRA
jgi:hypothetical protein